MFDKNKLSWYWVVLLFPLLLSNGQFKWHWYYWFISPLLISWWLGDVVGLATALNIATKQLDKELSNNN